MATRFHGRRLMFAAALAVALALPGVANADTTGTSIPPSSSNGATITIGSVTLVQRVAVAVTLHVTCQPLHDVYYWETGEFVPTEPHLWVDGYVQVFQPAGRSVASAAGSAGGWAVCDGVTDNAFQVTLISGTTPFRNGGAVVGATINASAMNGSPQQPPYADDASSGAVSLRIR